MLYAQGGRNGRGRRAGHVRRRAPGASDGSGGGADHCAVRGHDALRPLLFAAPALGGRRGGAAAAHPARGEGAARRAQRPGGDGAAPLHAGLCGPARRGLCAPARGEVPRAARRRGGELHLRRGRRGGRGPAGPPLQGARLCAARRAQGARFGHGRLLHGDPQPACGGGCPPRGGAAGAGLLHRRPHRPRPAHRAPDGLPHGQRGPAQGQAPAQVRRVLRLCPHRGRALPGHVQPGRKAHRGQRPPDAGGVPSGLLRRPLRVCFVARIRDEKKFDSIEALSRQIARDVEKAAQF